MDFFASFGRSADSDGSLLELNPPRSSTMTVPCYTTIRAASVNFKPRATFLKLNRALRILLDPWNF